MRKVWVAKIKESIEWVLIDHPERDMSIVYILQCAQTMRVKIGITQNLDQRLKDIRAMSPTELKLVACFIVESQEVESFLHRQFKHRRIRGEWFDLSETDIETIRKLVSEYSELPDWKEIKKEKEQHDMLDFILRIGDEELKNEN